MNPGDVRAATDGTAQGTKAEVWTGAEWLPLRRLVTCSVEVTAKEPCGTITLTLRAAPALGR